MKHGSRFLWRALDSCDRRCRLPAGLVRGRCAAEADFPKSQMVPSQDYLFFLNYSSTFRGRTLSPCRFVWMPKFGVQGSNNGWRRPPKTPSQDRTRTPSRGSAAGSCYGITVPSLGAIMRNERHDLSEGPPKDCLLYTSPSPRDLSTSRMPSSA